MVEEKKSYLRSLYLSIKEVLLKDRLLGPADFVYFIYSYLSSNKFLNFIQVTFPEKEKDTGDWVITILSTDSLPGTLIKIIAKKNESGLVKIFLNHVYWLRESNNRFCLESQKYWLNPESLKIFEFNRKGEEAEVFLNNLYLEDSVIIHKVFAFFNKVKEKKFFQYNSDMRTAV